MCTLYEYIDFIAHIFITTTVYVHVAIPSGKFLIDT